MLSLRASEKMGANVDRAPKDVVAEQCTTFPFHARPPTKNHQ